MNMKPLDVKSLQIWNFNIVSVFAVVLQHFPKLNSVLMLYCRHFPMCRNLL